MNEVKKIVRERAFLSLLKANTKNTFYRHMEEYRRFGGDSNNGAVLVKALRLGATDIAKSIVKVQKTPRMFDALSNDDGSWPLKEAVDYTLRTGSTQVLELMLAKGANPEKHYSLIPYVKQRYPNKKVLGARILVLLLKAAGGRKSSGTSYQHHKTLLPPTMKPLAAPRNPRKKKNIKNASASIPGFLRLF